MIERRVDVLVDRVFHHSEGPMWDGRDESVIWVDQYAGTVHRSRLDAPLAIETFDLGAPVGAIVPRQKGGWIVSVGTAFSHLSAEGVVEKIVDVLPDDGIRRRMNDGKCDPLGRFWSGSIGWEKNPGDASLYRVTDEGVREMLTGVTISNGLAWSPDGATMYYIDTPTQQVRVYDVRGEAMEDTGVAVEIPASQGAPDGMCIDDDSCLWIAVWGSGCVDRYSPTGVRLDRAVVPAPQVSSCCLGGSDGRTLIITTSREGYSADDQRYPEAGKIFATTVSVGGPPADGYVW